MNRRFFGICLAIQLGGMVWVRAQASAAPAGVIANPTPGAGAAANPATETAVPTTEPEPLAKGVSAEQDNLDLDEAVKTYQSIIARFEKERAEAAHAIFRLADCYRKLGKIDEANRQYERILQEFQDQTDLAKASEDALGVAGRHRFSSALSGLAHKRDDLSKQKELLQSELALAEEQLKLSEERQKAGIEPVGSETSYNYKKDQLRLKGQIGQLEQSEQLEQPGATQAGVSASYGTFGNKRGKNNFQRSNGIATTRQDASLGGSASGTVGIAPPRAESAGADYFPAFGDEYQQSKVRSDRAKADFHEASKRFERLNRLFSLVKSSPPNALPESAVRGTRYSNLKADYEKALLDAADDSSQDKGVAEALKRLQTWIDKIYLPGLEAEINAAKDERDLAQEDVRANTRPGASNKRPTATPSTSLPEPATTSPAAKF